MLVGDKTLANNQIQLIHFISFIKLDFYDALLHCYYPQGNQFINKNIVMDSISSSSIAVILKLFPH